MFKINRIRVEIKTLDEESIWNQFVNCFDKFMRKPKIIEEPEFARKSTYYSLTF